MNLASPGEGEHQNGGCPFARAVGKNASSKLARVPQLSSERLVLNCHFVSNNFQIRLQLLGALGSPRCSDILFWGPWWFPASGSICGKKR